MLAAAGIAMVGGGRANSLLLPAVSGEENDGQGLFAEGFFAKSVDELMGGPSEMKTQVGLEQAVVGTEKKKLPTANDLAEGLQGTQITGGPIEPLKEASSSAQMSGDIEKAAEGKTPSEDADELKGSAAAVVEPQQSSLALGVSLAKTVATPVVANAAVISEEATSGQKLHSTGEPTTEAKRETKKKGNDLSTGGCVKAASASVDASGLQPAISTTTAVPVSVEVPVVPKVETGAASAKSFRVGPVGYKASANVATGIDASGDKERVHRGKEIVASAGGAATNGVHNSAGQSHNVEAKDANSNAQSLSGSGEIAVKPQGAGGTPAVAAVDGSLGVQGVVQKHSSGLGNDAGLPSDTVGEAVARSQETAGGEASLVNDGHTIVSATPTSLEVGVANGSHGWLKIRAELTDGGAVNASVSAASSAGQEMLHRELPSLTAYLQSERLGVSTVVVDATPATTATKEFSGAMSGGDQPGQAQQGGSSQSGDARQGLATANSDRMDEPVSSAGLEGVDADALSSAMYGEGGSGGGGWLSVRA